MAYNRKNILNRIVEIQNITIEHTCRGVTQQWVYQHVIFPKYFISIGTYYNYLACNAKGELKRLETDSLPQFRPFGMDEDKM